MIKAVLSWKISEEGFWFSASDKEHNIAFEDWPEYELYSKDKRSLRIGPLWRLYQDGLATEEKDGSLFVSHYHIAKLSPGELKTLSLPPPLPYILHIESKGKIITEPDFKLWYYFWHPENRPIRYYERIGALIRIGKSEFILSEPLYSILNALDDFNNRLNTDLDSKMVTWGTLKELLGKEIVLDDYLSTINVVKADNFSLAPFINSYNEPDFDPVLVRIVKRNIYGTELETNFRVEPILPQSSQEIFSKQFRRLSKVKNKYPVDNGWFVIIPDYLKAALEIVKEIQDAPPELRRRFVLNPRPFMKERLKGSINDDFLEELFQETDSYGERVRDIGIWQPPVVPFIKKISKEPWLPPEALGIRLGDKWVIIAPEDLESLREKVFEALKNNVSHVEYKGEPIPASEQSLSALETLIGEIALSTEKGKPDKKPKPLKQVLIIYGNLEDLEIETKSPTREGTPGETPIDLLKTPLLPHQLEGVRWLQDHWVKGSPGALLADDMGLGKTLQALVFMGWVRKMGNNGPFLVVAPTGLLNEWAQQHEQHLRSPGLGELIKAYGGALKDLRKVRERSENEMGLGFPILDTERLSKAGWVLATYETIRDYQFSFGKVKWQVVIFDEAQKIKSPLAQVTHACKALQAEFSIAMTGTPVENRPGDIWCIVDAVRPGELGSLKEFCYKYEKTERWDLKNLAELSASLMSKKKPPIVLRRIKGEYLKGLPNKIEHVLEKQMPSVQAEAYDNVISWARNCVSGKGAMLEALIKLRSVSLHPLDYELTDLSMDEYIKSSAKLKITMEILDQIAKNGEKALVFLESRAMQGYLAEIIKRRYTLPKMPAIINGGVPGAKRKDEVEKFQDEKGFGVLIMSPRAGGVGFTITAANHVIHLSRWWNPAVEDQCTDRVYRISQVKDVHVYYLIARHPKWGDASFDCRLNELLKNKRQICKNILAPVSCSENEVEEIYNKTIWADRENVLDEIDKMAPLDFERWVANRLREIGFEVNLTPQSGDGGADVIAFCKKGLKVPNLIIQIKHTTRKVPLSEESVDQVLNALTRYKFGPPVVGMVVSNCYDFTQSARQKAEEKKVVLVDRFGLHGWPDRVFRDCNFITS